MVYFQSTKTILVLESTLVLNNITYYLQYIYITTIKKVSDVLAVLRKWLSFVRVFLVISNQLGLCLPLQFSTVSKIHTLQIINRFYH